MEIDKLTQYLAGVSYTKAAGDKKPAGPYPFIAISRQTGAGGHSLAQALLSEMEKRNDPLFRGWQMFDEEICRRIADNPKLKVLLESLLAEKFRTGIEDFLAYAIADVSPQDKVIREIFQMLRDVALVGKSIIVGRGATSLMRRHPHGVFVRLIAPLENRVDRIMERQKISRKDALKHIMEQDLSRARLVKRYFKQDINDPLLYNCVWNTENVPIEVVARAIVVMVAERAENVLRHQQAAFS